jgi:signal peptidase I
MTKSFPVTQLRRFAAWLRRSGTMSLVLMLTALMGFRSAVADWHDVPSGSMIPTLLIGDRIVVDKLAYDVKVPFTGLVMTTRGQPARGDIVTCKSPADGRRLVKRIVGLPGDVISLRANRLTVNGADVAYDPADEAALRQMVGADAATWTFLTEGLPDHPHIVALSGGGRRPDLREFQVPAGKYFLMGDNRDQSADSRWFGFVERKAIAGRVIGLAGSLDTKQHFRPRWERFCRGVA